MLPIEYEKLCFPFISLSFCRLIILVGSGVTFDLHAGVHCHTNSFINILLILHQSYNFIRFEPLLWFQGQVVKSKTGAIIFEVPWLKMIVWVMGVLRRTVVGDWCFNNLCGSHLQSHLSPVTQMIIFYQSMLLLGSNHFLIHWEYVSIYKHLELNLVREGLYKL